MDEKTLISHLNRLLADLCKEFTEALGRTEEERGRVALHGRELGPQYYYEMGRCAGLGAAIYELQGILDCCCVEGAQGDGGSISTT